VALLLNELVTVVVRDADFGAVEDVDALSLSMAVSEGVFDSPCTVCIISKSAVLQTTTANCSGDIVVDWWWW